MLILAGIAVDGVEEQEVAEADEAGGGEAPAPAKVKQQDPDNGHAQGGGELGHGIEDGGGQAALLLGEPVADGLGVGGKGGCLPNAQQEARGKQPADAGGDGRAEGSKAPQQRTVAANSLHTEAVQQHADRQLQHCVSQAVGAQQVAEGHS